MILLSIVALLAGPLVYHFARPRGALARAVDSVMAAVLAVLVASLLVAEIWPALGMSSVLLVALGYLVPLGLEFSIKRAAHAFHMIGLGLALLGLALHALLDGAGLGVSEYQGSAQLATAIIVHRVGVGLVLWLLVQPESGTRAAVLVLSMMAVLTVVGYALAEQILPLADDRGVQRLQALVVGTIIHSLVHRGHAHRDHTHARDT